MFAGATKTGVPVNGSLSNGSLDVVVGGTNMRVNSNGDSDDECDLHD